MVKHKKLTSKNGITIPKDLREEAGFYPGMAVDVETNNGEIIIRKHVPICKFCGALEKVHVAMGIDICEDCAEKIAERVGKKHG